MSKSQRNNFRPLQTINEERSTHGLRYGDYARYRKHCAAKTHRLRVSLKMTHGKGREFKKLAPITPAIAKEGHLQLLLFETERAWAHAQELSAPQDSRRSTARYRRSHGYLARLLSLVRSPELAVPLTSQGIVELIVYALIHTARFNLRRPSASTAAYYTISKDSESETEPEQGETTGYPLVQLSVAHALLSELEKTARTSKEVALARAFKDEIGPEIRWCVHEFSRSGDGEDEELEAIALKWKKREWDIEGIVGDVAPAYAERVVSGYGEVVSGLRAEEGDSAGKKEVLEELMWDGEPVPVRNPELVDVLLKVQEARGRLRGTDEEGATAKAKGRGKMSKYDAVLHSLSDAVDVARKLVEAQQVSGSTRIGGGRDMDFMHGFLTYLHLTYRIERDLILLGALDANGSNNAAILHLLAGVLQSLSQTLTLPIVDESPDLSTAITLRLSHAKAERALHLARAYAHPSQKRYAEAVAATQRGHLHIREARSTLAILPGPSEHVAFYPVDDAAITALEDRITKEEDAYKQAWFAGGEKAVFFDIAFNYIEAPVERLRVRAGLAKAETVVAESSRKAKAESESAVAEDTAPEETPTRGGLSGFLGSWWGRR
ncbi:hypothetical protein M422DRAFT_251428 [Sphaerobolus stellatus SS14]|uniref:Signal recognition particle subunit SRP68 n=1 Tax=Sphaerobolus stellatus (strain SS14) TaxID=990650 RepID=A0A0C9UQN1_SPHS4|nr:hypothetical protein M422DRAFT_251428 [Sphaerobolus stellatus SS14]